MINNIFNLSILFKKIAQYDPSKIEELSAKNPYPFKSWFDANGRAYVPFSAEYELEPSDAEEYITELLEGEGYIVTDYVGGYAEKNNRKMRIGRLLQDIKKKYIKDKETKLLEAKNRGADEFELESISNRLDKTINFIIETEREFSSDPKRANKSASGLSIVFTQNPHDVATMSTGRGWTSCMNLEGGAHRSDVFCEVSSGGFVAYLINSTDTDIKSPLARVHIRRFMSKDGRNIAIPEESVYGNDSPGFLEAVKAWVDSKQGKIQAGHYKRQGGEWSDTFKSKDHFVLSDNVSTPDDLQSLKNIIMGQFPEGVDYTLYNVEDLLFDDYDSNDEDEAAFENRSESFGTREEAQAYIDELNNLESIQDERLYVPYEPWVDEYGEVNYDQPRFQIKEKQVNNSNKLLFDAIKKILEFPKGSLDKETLDKLKELSYTDYDNVKELNIIGASVFKKYPELFSEEEIKNIANKETYTFEHSIENMPKEMANKYKQEYISRAESALDDPRLILPYDFEEKLKQKSVFSGHEPGYTELETNFNKLIDRPIIDYVSDGLSEMMIRKLTSFVDRLQQYGVDTNKSNIKRIKESICHILMMKDADTPSAQNFYEKMLDEFINNGEFNINKSQSLFRAIAALGENGKRFIPKLNKLLATIKEKYEEIKQSEADIKNFKLKECRKSIMNLLYVIDSIESETGRSYKYEWAW